METHKLRNAIIDQAKYFLVNAGEFYPFGTIIAKNGSIVPLGVQMENDHPESHDVIEILRSAIIEKLKTGEAELGAIGIDVFYKSPDANERKSAIQIRILNRNGDTIDYYAPYENNNGEFTYGNIFTNLTTRQ